MISSPDSLVQGRRRTRRMWPMGAERESCATCVRLLGGESLVTENARDQPPERSPLRSPPTKHGLTSPGRSRFPDFGKDILGLRPTGGQRPAGGMMTGV
jgi:hypothetical protein